MRPGCKADERVRIFVPANRGVSTGSDTDSKSANDLFLVRVFGSKSPGTPDLYDPKSGKGKEQTNAETTPELLFCSDPRLDSSHFSNFVTRLISASQSFLASSARLVAEAAVLVAAEVSFCMAETTRSISNTLTDKLSNSS